MATKDLISVPRRGGISDVNIMNTPDSSFLFCFNGAMETKSGDSNVSTAQNEGSNILAVNFPDEFQVIGRRYIPEQDRTIFMLVNAITGVSQIGEVLGCSYNDDSDDIVSVAPCEDCEFPIEIERKPLETVVQKPYCSYHKITESNCLGFNINYPISIRYRITDCSLNIYFTDRNKERRFLYFDYNTDGTLSIQNRFKVISGYDSGNCDQPIYEDTLDCNKILYHPKYEIPCIDLTEVSTGGSLAAGTYQFLAAYSDALGNVLTDFTPATNIVPIFTKQVTIETNYATDKSIVLKLNNLEKTNVFAYYVIVAAETVDNFTTFKKIGAFPVNQSVVRYTGNEDSIKLTADDLFFQRIYYKTAGKVTNANDFLFFSDLTEFHKPNLQRVANKVKLYWATVAIPEAVYKDPQNSFRFRSADRDEVYPYGLVFEMDNGQEYGPYHIPGPSSAYFLQNYGLNVEEIINNNDVQEDTSCSGLTRNKRWQVYNTAFTTELTHEVVKDCDFNHIWEQGEFSYWESIRTYPNDPEVWGDLCGQPIRHHKFPDSSVTHIHDGLNGSKTFFDNNIVYPIGVRVDNNSVKLALQRAVIDGVISQEDKDRIVGYRIIRGNRVGNESNIAKGHLFDMWNYSKNGKTYYYPNYPYNDLRPDYFISNHQSTYQGSNTSNPNANTFTPTKRYTFHSPDIHFKNPTIGTELKLETVEYGQAEGFFNLCEEQAKQKFLSTAATTLALAAGIAAAFTTDNKTECKTIITRNQQAIDGVVPGVITTLPAIPDVTGSASLFLTDPLGASKYEPITGLEAFPLTTQFQANEVQRNTCRSKTRHLLSVTSLSPIAIFLQELVYIGMLSMKEMNIIEELILAMVPLKNLSVQYNSVGKYNNYKTIGNSGNKVRAIERHAYLEPTIQLIDETLNATTGVFTNVLINNWNRERSVYLKTDMTKPAFPNPSVADSSRFTMGNVGMSQSDLLKRVYSNISSYYCTVKRFVPDQYGQIADIQYVETTGCGFNLSTDYSTNETMVFGGDKFITRFGLKRKMPFFLQTRFRQLPQSDVKYSELGNVGYPNYYFDSHESLMERVGDSSFSFSLTSLFSGALFQDILGVPRTRLDVRKNKFFYQSGFIHLYNYGIPYFLVESDVNTDFRHGENNLEKDFYPHQQDLEFWLQEKNVPITEDNYYTYNKTYSKQDKESFIGVELPDEDLRECTKEHPNRVIVSLEVKEDDTRDRRTDNWLIFRPNDASDFQLSHGKILGLDGIESDKVLVRFENTSKVFNAYDVFQSDSKEIQVGNAGLFTSRPKEFYSTTLGYAGTQHSDILLTEFGHIWTDSKRGQIFNLEANGASLKDLTLEGGVSGWFRENLPFQLKRDFPEIDLRNLDNNYKGIGLHLSFDKRFSRIFITKLDYKVKKNCDGKQIKVIYSPSDNEFYLNGSKISVYDNRYFCNKSFTTSYNFKTKNWIYHPFTPNFYVDAVDYTQSGMNFDTDCSVANKATLWSHNLTNKSYQVFYGKLYPFIVDIPSEAMLVNNILNSVEFDTEAIRYHNQYDYTYDRLTTFNKAWVWNERQFSGELDLVVRNENNMADSVSYPKVESGRQKVLITNFKNKWSFNQFWDTVNTQKGNIPFLLNACDNVNKVINLKTLDYFKPDAEKQKIRGKQTRIRLIADKDSNKKILLHFVKTQITEDGN